MTCFHYWPFSYCPESIWRGDTPFEAAKLLEEGHLDTSHVLDARQQSWGRKKGPKPPNHMTLLAGPRHQNKRLIKGKDLFTQQPSVILVQLGSRHPQAL